VTTTNPVYHCEELEDNASLYDEISEENVGTAEHQEKPDNEYLDILSDEIEQCYQGPELPLPRPEPETRSGGQDHDYEGLTDKKADHMYLQLLNDEGQKSYQQSTDVDQVQDTEAQDRDTKNADGDQEQNTKPQD